MCTHAHYVRVNPAHKYGHRHNTLPPPPHTHHSPHLQGVVRKVEAGSLTLTDGTVIPFGLCIWSTGVGPTPFTLSLPFAKTQVRARRRPRGLVYHFAFKPALTAPLGQSNISLHNLKLSLLS